VYSSLEPMHIPDGFLSARCPLCLWILAVMAIGAALKRVAREMGERLIPVMGCLQQLSSRGRC